MPSGGGVRLPGGSLPHTSQALNAEIGADAVADMSSAATSGFSEEQQRRGAQVNPPMDASWPTVC